MNNARRFYRSWHKGRFHSFSVGYKETDLWIGVDKTYEEMPEAALQFITRLRQQLEDYIKQNPVFLTSFKPVNDPIAVGIVRKMLDAAELAHVGPMAAVAGAVADQVGSFLSYEFGCREVIVENGGDLFVKVQQPIVVSIFAGNSPLSGRIGLKVPAGNYGICTSSGTVGPSISFGKADAVTMVARSGALADAFATYYGNQIRQPSDVRSILNSPLHPEVDTLLVIIGNTMGTVGKHQLRILEGGGNDESY